MSDLVRHLNPAAMPRNPAFSQAVSVAAGARTVYIGGQNGVDAAGQVVGTSLEAQTEQTFANLATVLREAGGTLHDIVKWTIFVVPGHDIRPALGIFERVWGHDAPPPAISVVLVVGMANPDRLVEIEAIAVIAERED